MLHCASYAYLIGELAVALLEVRRCAASDRHAPEVHHGDDEGCEHEQQRHRDDTVEAVGGRQARVLLGVRVTLAEAEQVRLHPRCRHTRHRRS